MFKVYGKTNCPSCTSAKQLLETKGCEYEYLLFGKDYDLSKFVEINKTHKTMPMITVVKDGVENYIGGLVELKEVLATKYSK
jgi:glutaredoxin